MTAESAETPTIRALGLHHTLLTAVADLIDNSVDAGAQHVLVRFLQSGQRVSGLRIVDDGLGMDPVTIDAAMRYGTQRAYRGDEQDHFGVGLKAASLSQADQVTVYSHAVQGDPVGRRLTVEARHDAPRLDVVDDADAARVIDTAAPRFPFRSGTIVEWRGIRTFPNGVATEEQGAWLEVTVADLQAWLGLVFHRLIADGLTITVDVADELAGRAGVPRSVRPVDPFGYRTSGGTGYPKSVSVLGSDVVTAHIWPARSTSPDYKLDGRPGRDSQGFFVYRNGRLLQAGGWLGVLRPRPEWALARVAIDIDTLLAEHITINPEKAGVTLDATLATALHDALGNYLDDAAATAVAARRVQRRPITVVEPGTGLPDEVADEFADTFTFAETAEPVQIGWRVLPQDRFFEIDLESRALWLNARLRRKLGGRRRSNGADLPVLRTLVFLLAQDMFDAVRHSARQVEQIDAWQRVLIAALAAEDGGDE
ncbi:ATP-binding protein [Gordonia amicalis]|uniref:ATP-binding protein n=1 Tax=Gordonia amicalis TaxID=89053 RepID=UPI0022A704CA|nr:ATP-binding protein [Gordonia amicalis]MCZ0914431.1 ATP-binding protein [Gordonia amicalis]